MSAAKIRLLGMLLLLLLALIGLFLLLRPDYSGTDASGGPQEQTYDLAISGGTMSPEEISVDEGERVNLQITSDAPLEFHLHGYDLEKEVEPGEPAELSFDATTTGRFEIENHDTESVLGALLVQPS
ncbi:MAG: cupredoxin domain-containing protein [Actinomycetota bacterium]|nr:cupredoxin domain-containing protein [Actinomycetota bacterium]